ncbi:MAG: alpha/beta hydrolase [Gammaproteobacteria bacterium]|nr:alpha/beta hydrolase [Gammaproteobacteria bacterium]
MRGIITTLVFLFISLTSLNARADILVLVHGYLGSANSWEASGINALLDANGWKRGGLISSSPDAVAPVYVGPGQDADNKVYLVDLPAEAPIVVQTDQFLGMLATIQTMHPDDQLIIVGHSAGGIVARMALVRGQPENIKALITIASPHVGTSRANQAIEATDESGPFGFVKSFFGGSGYDTLRRSRGLLFDLAHPYPGSLLYWLNGQKHPDIEYVSVVRLNPVGFAGDELVPGYSQDMNNVPTIQGSSSVIVTPAGHTLVAQDGTTLLQILERMDDSEADVTDAVS